MKLSDVMSAMQLSSYAEVALVIFFFTFLAVVIYIWRGKNQATWEKARQMPLDDEHPQTPIAGQNDEEVSDHD